MGLTSWPHVSQDEEAGEDAAEAELQEADELYARAAALAPDNSDVLYQRALFLKNVREDYDEAEELLQRVIGLQPRDATALCNYAVLLHQVRGDPVRAQELYRAALALPAESVSEEEIVSVLYSYGSLCQGSLRQPAEARQLYQRALQLAPSDAAVLNKLGVLLHNHFNDTAASERCYVRALEEDADQLDVICNYALLQQHLKRHQQAYTLLKR